MNHNKSCSHVRLLESETSGLVDIAPLQGRLLLFYSDFRVPHEVLPVEADISRFAVTIWYTDREPEASDAAEGD